MTASCMTCIYSQLTKEQYPCSECYYGNSGNPSKHEPVVEAPDINVGNMDTTTHDSIPAKTGKNDGDRTSGDCISRAQAIDMIKEIYEWHDSVTKERIIEHFKQLPSAQPDIIRCKDCKYYKYGICMKIGANKSFYGFCDWAERGEQNGRLNQQDAGG